MPGVSQGPAFRHSGPPSDCILFPSTSWERNRGQRGVVKCKSHRKDLRPHDQMTTPYGARAADAQTGKMVGARKGFGEARIQTGPLIFKSDTVAAGLFCWKCLDLTLR